VTALYRKYRPQDFDEVVGQDPVVRTLKNAIASGQVRQAYLFAGPRGTGKTSMAKILARSLNCEQGPTPTPCGVTTCPPLMTRSSMVWLLPNAFALRDERAGCSRPGDVSLGATRRHHGPAGFL
jgi:energy-coupling factor transporter ATP-binding protein EcfA2